MRLMAEGSWLMAWIMVHQTWAQEKWACPKWMFLECNSQFFSVWVSIAILAWICMCHSPDEFHHFFFLFSKIAHNSLYIARFCQSNQYVQYVHRTSCIAHKHITRLPLELPNSLISLHFFIHVSIFGIFMRFFASSIFIFYRCPSYLVLRILHQLDVWHRQQHCLLLM